MRLFLPATIASLTLASINHAAVVATFNFSDSTVWDVSVGLDSTGTTTALGSGVTGGGTALTVDKQSSSGSVFLTANLVGSINTTGFFNLELRFSHQVTGGGNMEWDDPDYIPGGSFTGGDGFRILSSQGISFDTNNAPAAFETALDASPATWSPTSATPFSQDLTFDPVTFDALISDLTIQLQTNANTEDLTLSNFEIHGTPIPEPSRALLAALALASTTLRRRRRR